MSTTLLLGIVGEATIKVLQKTFYRIFHPSNSRKNWMLFVCSRAQRHVETYFAPKSLKTKLKLFAEKAPYSFDPGLITFQRTY